MRANCGRSASRGEPSVRLVRRNPLPLLAVRAGWFSGQRTVGRPADPLDAHDGEGQNLSLANGDQPEPSLRVLGEQQVVDCADRLIANTESEAVDLRALYGADEDQTAVVHPGVDLDQFSPGDKAQARERRGLPQSGIVLLFVGRIQPLKSPTL